jgi:hypothetical protein
LESSCRCGTWGNWLARDARERKALVAIATALLAVGLVGLFALVAGLMLLLAPRRTLGSPLGRRLVQADVTKVFDRRFVIERRVYRRHRWAGAFVVVGALAGASLLWLFQTSQAAALAASTALGPIGLRVLALVSMVLILLVLVVGVLLFVRPSALKGMEAKANRWIHLGDSRPNAFMQGLVLRAPRVTGLLLFAAGLVCLRVLVP